jgi:hypothetical protein
VRERDTEDGHDRVARELLESSSVLLDPLPCLGVVDAQSVTNVFRVRPVRPCGEADEVDEQDRDQLALLATRCCVEWSAAAAAEAGIRGMFLAAARTARGLDDSVINGHAGSLFPFGELAKDADRLSRLLGIAG